MLTPLVLQNIVKRPFDDVMFFPITILAIR